MRILLIHPESNNPFDKPYADEFFLPYGISLIAGILRSQGHDIDIFVATRTTPMEKIDSVIKSFDPQIIGVSSVVSEYNLACMVARYIKKIWPDIPIILGGPYSRTAPEHTTKGPWDYICVDEGELPLIALVNALLKGSSVDKIPGIWIRKGLVFLKNKPGPLITDLDSIPFMERDAWKKWVAIPGVSHGILLSRGCPFSCSYCSNHIIRKHHQGDKYVRFRSVKNILSELKMIITNNPNTYSVYFETEALNNNPSFISSFCSSLQEFNNSFGINIPYKVNLAPFYNHDWNSLFKTLRQANICGVNIGLESGSERVRREILNRRYSNETIMTISSAAKRNNVWLCFYVLIGLPGETFQDFQETVDLCKKTKPDSVALSIFEPYPGTTLYTRAVESGLMEELSVENFVRTQATFDLPGFSREEIQKEFESFNDRIGVDPLIGHLKYFLNSDCNIDKYIPVYRDYYKKAYSTSLLPVW